MATSAVRYPPLTAPSTNASNRVLRAPFVPVMEEPAQRHTQTLHELMSFSDPWQAGRVLRGAPAGARPPRANSSLE